MASKTDKEIETNKPFIQQQSVQRKLKVRKREIKEIWKNWDTKLSFQSKMWIKIPSLLCLFLGLQNIIIIIIIIVIIMYYFY